MTQLLGQQLAGLTLGTGSCLWCGQPGWLTGSPVAWGAAPLSPPAPPHVCKTDFSLIIKSIIYSCRSVVLPHLQYENHYSSGDSP